MIPYVLITPARNEEAFLEETIRSVVTQTVLPRKWVIVSDGSTDRTDDIVRAYVRDHPWIELVRMPERSTRNFAAKVLCFNAGFERMRDIDYQVIGNLDADITFGPEYFEFLLGKFAEFPALGVAGTPFIENGSHYDYRFTNIEHVSGACQLFRRECYRDIGGYVPVAGGGIDWIAVTTARMKGWMTRTFVEMTCVHHRTIGTGSGGALRSWMKQGRKDYVLGGHPLWQACRAVYQMKRRPYILGGLLMLTAYTWAMVKGEKRSVSRELMLFHRKEQMQRAKNALLRLRSRIIISEGRIP
jgi:biofilm PGA synthesis N-glycosyltransferase PgaC